MVDFNEAQFCDDHGYCICGNDCGAGCCTTDDPCDDHRAAWAAEDAAWARVQTPTGVVELGPEDFGEAYPR